MFKIILMSFLFLWLVLFFGISFFSWKIRKKVMEKFALKNGLKFVDNKDNFRIEGFYKNRNVIIKGFIPSKKIIDPAVLEFIKKEKKEVDPDSIFNFGIEDQTIGALGLPLGSPRFRNISKIVIRVDDKKIYDEQKGVLFLLPTKIKSIIDHYISDNKIKRRHFSLQVYVLIFVFVLILLFLLVFATNPNLFLDYFEKIMSFGV